MKQPKVFKVMSVKLDLRDRLIVAKLQKKTDLTFSQLVRYGLRAIAKEQKVSAE